MYKWIEEGVEVNSGEREVEVMRLGDAVFRRLLVGFGVRLRVF
jgi:hypothetical protein